MKSTKRIIQEAILLSLVSCICVFGFAIVKLYQRASFLGAIICVMPIALPITHLMWHQSRRKFERFRAAPWHTFEHYMQFVYEPHEREADIKYIDARFLGEGTQCIGGVILLTGHYHIEAELPPGENTHFEIRPDQEAEEAVSLFSSDGTSRGELTVTDKLTGGLCVKTPAPETPWSCSIKTSGFEEFDSIDRGLLGQSILFIMRGSGERISVPVHLPSGDYDLRWYTPFSNVRIELLDAEKGQPNIVIIQRTPNRRSPFSRAKRFYVRFRIKDEGEYRLKVVVHPRSQDDRWLIVCAPMED